MSYLRTKPRRPGTLNRLDWCPPWPVWAAGGFFLLISVVCLIQIERVYGPQKSDVPVTAVQPEPDLRLDTGKLKPMQPHLFQANVSGKTVRFVVERTRDNVVHVALATCSVCFRSRNPHYVRNGEMICGQCNGPMPFAPKGQTTVGHSCLLVEIPHRVINGELIVSMRDVIAQNSKLSQ